MERTTKSQQRNKRFGILNTNNCICLWMRFSFYKQVPYTIIFNSQCKLGNNSLLEPFRNLHKVYVISQYLKFGLRIHNHQDIAKCLHQGRNNVIIYVISCKGPFRMSDKHGLEAFISTRHHLIYKLLQLFILYLL